MMFLIDLTNKLEWMAQTSYSAGDILRDNNIPDGYIATCTTAGISGETEPEWQVGTLTDGTMPRYLKPMQKLAKRRPQIVQNPHSLARPMQKPLRPMRLSQLKKRLPVQKQRQNMTLLN